MRSAGSSGRTTSARPVSTNSSSAARGESCSSVLDSSTCTRSGVIRPSSPAMSVMAATTSSSGVSPSWATKRTARSIRSGSSAKESAADPGVRSRRASRSPRPPNGSVTVRSGPSETAIALTVKSRRTRSSSSEAPHATSGFRDSRSYRSARNVVISTRVPRISAPTVPKAMPVFHVERAQPSSRASTCSGRASVVTSRSPGTDAGPPPTPAPADSSASRTEPPTRCASNPAAVKRSPSSVRTGESSTSSRTVACTAGGTGSPGGRRGGVADTTSQPSAWVALPSWHGWDRRARTPRASAAPGRRDLRRGAGGGRRRRDRAPGRPDRPHRPPRPPALVPPQGAHRGGRDPRGHRRPRGRRGDGHYRRGRRAAGHHRLLVRRRRPPRPQDRAPLPAARDRGSPLRRRHRGDGGRLGAPGRAERPPGLRRRAGTGRARAGTAGRQRVRRSALLRAAVAPVLLAALGVLAPPASAGPLAPDRLPLVTAAPGDDDTGTDRPVSIEVGRFEPRTVTPGATVTVTGTLTNAGPSTITDLSIRLQRGAAVTTRAQLAALTTHPDPATDAEPPFLEVPGALEPGGDLPFSYNVAADALGLDRDGVYPALLNVNGTVDGAEQQRVGELRTFLVRQPVVPSARTAVAWLWPLVERTHRAPSGGFADDGLADAVRSGGRLDRALAVVERLPATQAAGSSGPVPALQVTLVIDPALVEELTLMAAGPYAVDGVDGAGRGTEAAAAFLDRLRGVAGDHPVVALSYGDVDADALVSAGLTDVLVRSLPGSPEGTAQDPPGSDANGDAAVATPGAETPAPEPERSDVAAGVQILADALDVEPRSDVAWAAGGALRPETLLALEAGGVDEVVLGTDGISGGDAATGLSGSTAAARTTVGTASGPLDALVADTTLGQVVASAEQATGGARLAEQRFLAELAVLGLQAAPGSEQTVLVAPPRNVDAGPDGAGAMMADTAGLLWLRPSTTAELATGPSSPAGELLPPTSPGPDAAGMADVAEAVSIRESMAAAVVGDADIVLRGFDAAVSRTTSSAWRTDPARFREAAAGLRSTMERLRGRVTLVAPADGTYSLGSSDAPLVLTVSNDLPFAVDVRLDVRTRGIRGLSISDIGVQTLAPLQRTTLQVPTEVRQSGGFAVTAQLTTPDGGPLGDRIQLQVKSTAYGSISLLITIGAAVLLGLLFLRRLIRFLLRRRRAAAALPEGGPEGATVALPPNRSPV